jgi:hypothetical protein
MARKRSSITLALLCAVALGVAIGCGGGGHDTSGPADGVITEGDGSGPVVLPPDDPGAPPPDDPVPGGLLTAKATSAEFVVTLTVADPAPGPAHSSSGLPTFSAPQPLTLTLELHNVSGQPQTLYMLDTSFLRIVGRHQVTGNEIWPPVLTFAPPTPYYDTLAPDERRSYTKIWLTSGFGFGPYSIDGRVATNDARVPGLVRVELELE